MLESVLCAIGTVFAVIGIVSAAYALMLRLIRPKKHERRFEVLFFDETETDACGRVSFLLTQLMGTGNIRGCTVVAVDTGMKPWRRRDLDDAFGREPHVKICSPEEAQELLFGKKEGQNGQSTVFGSSGRV